MTSDIYEYTETYESMSIPLQLLRKKSFGRSSLPPAKTLLSNRLNFLEIDFPNFTQTPIICYLSITI